MRIIPSQRLPGKSRCVRVGCCDKASVSAFTQNIIHADMLATCLCMDEKTSIHPIYATYSQVRPVISQEQYFQKLVVEEK